MPTFTQASDWDSYKNVINGFNSDAFNQPLVWRKTVNRISEYGEDNSVQTQDIPLLGLMWYNDYRSWPTTIPTPTGLVDGQSSVLYLNIKYLEDTIPEHLNPQGFLKIDSGNDSFIVNGQTYKSTGESQTAQASDKPLILFLILKREETESHNDKY